MDQSLPRASFGSYRPWALGALTLIAAAGLGWFVVRPALPPPSPSVAPAQAAAAISGNSLYQLDSRWTTERGRPLGLAELAGKARVVSMIFTSCPSACPTLVKEMQALERKLPDDVRARTGFVLVSIDPDRDTPQVLQQYGQKMGLVPERWTLLRGEADDVRELSATLGVSYGKGEGADIAHSKLITVLNPRGEIVHQQMGVVNDPDRLVAAVARAL